MFPNNGLAFVRARTPRAAFFSLLVLSSLSMNTGDRALAATGNSLNSSAAYGGNRPVAMRNGLPSCRMDSFVKEAGIHAEHIYGDESHQGPPPYDGFTRVHRINTGIVDTRDEGLTTGHGSVLPAAWGRDEFIGGSEFLQSGAAGNSGNSYYAGTPNRNPVSLLTKKEEAQKFAGGWGSLDYGNRIQSDEAPEWLKKAVRRAGIPDWAWSIDFWKQ